MLDKTKVALFDFCDTCVSFQTANAFVEYALSRYKVRWFLYVLFKIIDKTKLISAFYYCFISHGASKRLPLLFLKGVGYGELNQIAKDFYNERLVPRFIVPIIDQLRERKREGCTIIVVSGGYSIYINYFAKEFGVDNVIANDIIFSNNKCMGKYNAECMGHNKVTQLGEIIPLDRIDKSLSWAYTDDKSDLPILELVQNPVVVSKNKEQEWVKKSGINNEIVYKF